ncbi:MAG: methyltransferase domain-containing protein [Alphaproteobacteria bacterium]|nr:methyltransferase domain-containing protein [Alphaproteobacteria bacterium]
MSFRRIRLAGLEGMAFASRDGAALEFAASLGPLRRLLARMATKTGPGFTEAQPAAAAEATAGDALAALKQRIGAINWYHTIDLGNGLRTPGAFDHAPVLARYNLPASFAGQRVLDCATFDGYWAFEFERRGAREVVALDIEKVGDIDLPPRRRAAMSEAEKNHKVGAGFALCKEVLDSKVERKVCNLYDLSPGYAGMFDVVHLGDVLLHLADPILALQNLRSVTQGYALISDCFWPELDRYLPATVAEYYGGEGENAWWRPSEAALFRMVHDAGFRKIEVLSRLTYSERGYLSKMYHLVLKATP